MPALLALDRMKSGKRRLPWPRKPRESSTRFADLLITIDARHSSDDVIHHVSTNTHARLARSPALPSLMPNGIYPQRILSPNPVLRPAWVQPSDQRRIPPHEPEPHLLDLSASDVTAMDAALDTLEKLFASFVETTPDERQKLPKMGTSPKPSVARRSSCWIRARPCSPPPSTLPKPRAT